MMMASVKTIIYVCTDCMCITCVGPRVYYVGLYVLF